MIINRVPVDDIFTQFGHYLWVDHVSMSPGSTKEADLLVIDAAGVKLLQNKGNDAADRVGLAILSKGCLFWHLWPSC
jgi:hypothetical protein